MGEWIPSGGDGDTLGDLTPNKGSIAAGSGVAWVAKAAETDGFLLAYDSTMPSGIGSANPVNFQDADETLDSLVDLADLGTSNGRILALSNGGDVETFPDPSSGDILAQSGASPTGYAWQSPASAGVQATSEKGQANGYASLDGSGTVPLAQLPASVQTLLGSWNASTNTPTLADGTGDTGDTYLVTVAGSQDLGSGSIDFEVGDAVVYLSGDWERIGRNDLVASVAGKTGAVTLDSDDITDATTTGKAVLTAADAAAARSTLSAQQQDAALDDIAGLSLSRGVLLTVNASGNIVAVAAGSDGQVLTADANGDPAFADAAGGDPNPFNGLIKDSMTVQVARAAGSGNTTLYTCPSGKRALVLRTLVFRRSGGSSGSVYAQIYDGAEIWQQLSFTVNADANAGADLGALFGPWLLKAGDVFRIAENTGSGTYNAQALVLEFDDNDDTGNFVAWLGEGGNADIDFANTTGKILAPAGLFVPLGQEGTASTCRMYAVLNRDGSTTFSVDDIHVIPSAGSEGSDTIALPGFNVAAGTNGFATDASRLPCIPAGATLRFSVTAGPSSGVRIPVLLLKG